MVNQVIAKQHEAQLEQALILLEGLKQNKDNERIRKVEKLIKKIYDREFITAFSGHFSAGKSTMINALIGEEVLPSSPIPTSANLVKVHRSEIDYAKIYYEKESPLLFESPYEFQTVQSYCKSGDVTEVEIGKKDTLLQEGITVMDTPGVDSTDDAHRLSTESALHLADLVFYVMDYNHVQSELNFTYTKKLLEHGVKLYLIINQIDKHNDEELSFSEFKQTVFDSFAAWDVHPAGIYFTSLKDSEYKGNEFPVVKNLIDHALSHHENWLDETIETALNILQEEHIQWLQEEKQQNSAIFTQQLAEISLEDRQAYIKKEEQYIHNKEQLLIQSEKWQDHFTKTLSDTIKNAYLMPFETRQLAEDFLQSKQKEFKVGLIFSKRKTEEEKERRLALFLEKIQSTVDSQLTWHLRELARKELKEQDIHEVELQNLAQALHIEIDTQTICQTVKKGAGVTGESVLNFCDDVVTKINQLAKRAMEPFIEHVNTCIQQRSNHQIKQLDHQLDEISDVTQAIRSIERVENEYQHQVNQFLTNKQFDSLQLNELLQKWDEETSHYRTYSGAEEIIEEVKTRTKKINPEKQTQEASNKREEMMDQLQLALSLLENEQGFSNVVKQLKTKKRRLHDQNFTIALFGAFSAGKSSFANALLGERVLPVSPNPTTAAINRICPPNEEFTHGTAEVHLKAEEILLVDIQESLKVFAATCYSLDEAYRLIPSVLQNDTADGKEKIHLSFLRAFYEGLPQFKQQLGMSIKANMEDFREYVAVESQSCFVESIDLYYDCSFTKQGITLVDTPGADSINARHTDVAFEYIKNSDAILFVTYYNHAFSKADREFLIQLGRVKDAFELDKMFFLVNAIDLASTDDEVDLVLQYVHDQLLEYGIRFPRLFGISSKLAIAENTRAESNIDSFLEAFEAFLTEDLTGMVIQAAENEYNQLIHRLHQLIVTAKQNADEKEEKTKELQMAQEAIEQLLTKDFLTHLSERLSQEIAELLYYVNQRVYLRYPQFFKEAYNPARLMKNQKSLLQDALKELLQALDFDFSQEMRATSIRIEGFIQKLLKDFQMTIQGNIDTVQSSIVLSHPELTIAREPQFESPFNEVNTQAFEVTFKYFKNAKAFFEKNEKKIMEEQLEHALKPISDQYIEKQTNELSQFYNDILKQLLTKSLSLYTKDIEEQFAVLFSTLLDDGKIAHWSYIHDQLAARRLK